MMITLHQTDKKTKIRDVNGTLKMVAVESPDVAVNPDYIVAMIEHGGFTSISMVNGHTFSVKESVYDIFEKILVV